ncbi:hypothetical protein NEF87_004669 [Candidatus Lokiarchaeum ossiferum]|uniref:Transcription regulator AsnC/Lrp ligand binding domain-containing protein n=1 Tax=Candidatus Lokiarchaeum ossiferum TaxID=2951803 RepID=A0ABY6HXX5_9ARCH|nr:hypothetical protein NEF87_004669 [Candidatus Lokiarchaeum sp. B-35]
MGKVLAFTFLQIERQKRNMVKDYLINLPEVKAYYRLTGAYNGLVEIETNDTEEMYALYSEHIDNLDGILETQTQVVIKKFSVR